MNTITISTVFAASLVPTVAATLGAVGAAVRPPGATVRSYLQHLAAGVVFAVVASEVIPDLRRIHDTREIVIGFMLGVATMLGVRELTRRLAPEREGAATVPAPSFDTPERASVAMLVAVGIDIAVDGLLVGIGFAASAGTGRLLVIALTVELLSLGLAVATELARFGAPRVRVVALTAGLAALLVVFAVLGFSGLRGVPEAVLAVVLSFGAAALLFLVTEELLVEAHEAPETPTTTMMFFLGFLSLFVLDLLG